jgi:hypothetical protein
MEKLCQQFNSHGSKSAMRFTYFKIMTILFLVVLIFLFSRMYDTFHLTALFNIV